MHGWIAAVLNLLGMGAGTPVPPVTDPLTVTGTWEVPTAAGTWEVPTCTGTWEDL